MAKDKYVAGAGTAVAEDTDKDAEGTPTAEPTPAPAPEAPTTEETPAPAAAMDNRVTLSDIAALCFTSPQAKRVADQLEGLEKLAISLRSSVHDMIAVENKKGMNVGQQMFFTSVAQGLTWDMQKLAVAGQGILTDDVLVDNEGNVVESVKV